MTANEVVSHLKDLFYFLFYLFFLLNDNWLLERGEVERGKKKRK